ncbi:radical SAM protein [Bradyrhizobium sediminis]|uniref:Radical SAM protein n=2 Tax=Bradyrhizobium sediminis TaxID=2840469 RepID=A0A975P464_9BRAD|nr:radical SAM protein [Bradyrhizobium sediminis]
MSQGFQILEPDGPLLIFGGAYSNLEATAAMLAEAGRLGIPPERVICTGDVVAYGADADATATLVRDFGCHVVMGNCEESLASGTSDCGCGFPEDSACQRLSSAWFTYADRTVGAGLRAWMASLPRRIDVEIGGARLAVVHGGAEAINRFIFASTPASIKIAEIDRAGVDGIIGGHCGIPFTQVIDGRLWHNSGALGMPANDGTSSVWYSVLEVKGGVISIEHRVLDYDYRLAAQKMRSAGLPEGYAAALETGIWPSCDVLPFKEIRERGVALVEGSLEWRPHQGDAAVTTAEGEPAFEHLWPKGERANVPRLPEEKFKDPVLTAAGEPRASVALNRLATLWINTGTLCNIACRSCYIESSPRNDRLVYIRKAEVLTYLDEIAEGGMATEEIGLTGGEPFMNPEIIGILEACLDRGFKVLILTNGMRPMQRHRAALLDLNRRYGPLLTLRVSLDHYTADRHEEERGPGTFVHALSGLKWLIQNGFRTSIAGRTMWGEDPAAERGGYLRLLADQDIAFASEEPGTLVLFPEMEPTRDVPEITTACWGILHKSPDDVMCSSSRMVVKRKGAAQPVVVACTLLPYAREFELGDALKEAGRPVPLNHPFCSQFCVLGGSSCSGK